MTEQRSLYDKRKYKRQLRGWLSYAFASEVFVIVSLTLFLPICLEQFARDNGYLLPDLTNKCSAVQPMDASEDRRCVVKLAWLWIDTASFSLYVNSMSVALQALTVISLSGIADHPPHRKRLLLGFAFFGAVSATLFFALPSSSPLWPLSALLAIFANVGFGVSVVAMNAYLPTLAQQSEEVVKKLEALQNASTPGISSETPDTNVQTHSDATQEPLLPRDETIPELEHPEGSKLRTEYNSTLSTATSRISAMGIAIGYGAGIILLILSLVPVTKLGGSTFSLRLAIGSSGIWWAVLLYSIGTLAAQYFIRQGKFLS
ncbi:hypothetical protein QCA50_014965 [Cerrena zonata]|uniref:Autophagy-related protein n=1 Tax=Cerrena zonata TaxID=2478898 RepID=A0AAW0FMF7_9APHY